MLCHSERDFSYTFIFLKYALIGLCDVLFPPSVLFSDDNRKLICHPDTLPSDRTSILLNMAPFDRFVKLGKSIQGHQKRTNVNLGISTHLS